MASHPLAMAAAIANIEAIIDEGVIENAARMSEYVGAQLRALEPQHDSMVHADGIGLFWTIELVRNKEQRKPFVAKRDDMGCGDISRWPAQIVSRHCLQNGVFITGFSSNTLRIAPPLTVSRSECDEGIAALDSALSELGQECE